MKIHPHFILIFFVALIQISCINNNCIDDLHRFRIRFELKTQQRGAITIQYSAENSKPLNVTSKVMASEEVQFVEFCLDDEPLSFRVYVTESLENIDFTVLSLLLENKDRQMFIERDMLYLYFKQNELVEYNKETSTYIFNSSEDGQNRANLESRKSLQKRLLNRLKL
ncbi:hypothetical protein [Winogradskyella luteola]|uniref:Uncharacterized protein n=1 Tax=Winogradskyella luteola TaxID=2828330 RepID=A0A9X1F896_9FLAO|nr:hypothetical protein [Winogradskyella luteola]MBV7269172.1 hypothetical protein [Winogradskyella luteola]